MEVAEEKKVRLPGPPTGNAEEWIAYLERKHEYELYTLRMRCIPRAMDAFDRGLYGLLVIATVADKITPLSSVGS